MCTFALLRRLVLTGCLSVLIAGSSYGVTPVQYLQSQTRPTFRDGHTLYPVTIFGSGTSNRTFDVGVELANWGYALEIDPWSVNSTDTNAAKQLLNSTTSKEYKFIQLAKANPKKYKLNAPIIQARWNGMVLLSQTECPDCYARSSSGAFLTASNMPVLNLIMSDASLAAWGARAAWPYKYIERQFGVRVTVAFHQGEASFIPGDPAWQQAPAIVANRNSSGEDWFKYYFSKKWGRILAGVFQPVQNALTSDGIAFMYPNGGSYDRNRYGLGTSANSGWAYTSTYYEYTKDATLLSSEETYWGQGNYGMKCDNAPQDYSQLTKYLCAKGWEIACGKPFSYEWVASGWDGLGNCADDLWTGYTKIIYTCGTLGVNVGQYGTEAGYPADISTTSPALYIRQWMIHGRVHALFSWMDQFVRHSSLLPGPRNHVYSGQPAYEISPTSDCGARVVARKDSTANKWLICAWASTGSDRNVSVSIPTLGSVTVMARKTGTLYFATLNGSTPVLTMLDNDGMAVTVDTTTMKTAFGPFPTRINGQRLSLQNNSMQNGQFEIVDVMGRKIATSEKPILSLQRPGTYFVVRKVNGTSVVRKCVVIQ